MANKKRDRSELKFVKWLKEGRGSGHGPDYKPWLTVRDISSRGRSHRVFGHKSQRTHHLFSDLELAFFLLLEWHTETTEIREQFPLQRDTTLSLAETAGIKHPAVSGVTQYMTTDFLVNTSSAIRPKFAIQAKYAADLSDDRTGEKLELEKRYWQSKDVPWFIVTERNIPATVFENINWLYPTQRDEISSHELGQRIPYYTHHFQDNPGQSFITISKTLDMAYNQPPGTSLLEIRQLLAQRFFLFDIKKPFSALTSSDITLAEPTSWQRGAHVSGE